MLLAYGFGLGASVNGPYQEVGLGGQSSPQVRVRGLLETSGRSPSSDLGPREPTLALFGHYCLKVSI